MKPAKHIAFFLTAIIAAGSVVAETRQNVLFDDGAVAGISPAASIDGSEDSDMLRHSAASASFQLIIDAPATVTHTDQHQNTFSSQASTRTIITMDAAPATLVNL
jgi:hypothetical protein